MLSQQYQKNPMGIWTKNKNSSFNYSDGDEIEERLLQQLTEAEDISLASDELQRLMVDWPSEYHFSPLRANLLSPFQLNQFSNILEIGPGCGAITRQLGETCPNSNIIALEGSMRRAQITRTRCRELNNVEVCQESFAEFTSNCQFDLITMIGVLEYSPSFFKSRQPIHDALASARRLLNDNGVLIIAIENQLGLKYFNGCAEDHNAWAFWGINDQYIDGTVRTFGKRQLQSIIESAGFSQIEFVYPFPDYKLPQLVLREEAFDNDSFDIAHLVGQYPARDYRRDGDKIFRESRAWKLLSDNDLIRDFSNSFLVFAFKGDNTLNDITNGWLAQTFCGRRKKHYLVRNEFVSDSDKIVVEKKLCYPLEGVIPADQPAVITHHFGKDEYAHGLPYSYTLLDRVTEGDPIGTYTDYLRPWMNWLLERSFSSFNTNGEKILLVPKKLYDCMPANFLLDPNDQLIMIDQEWEYNGSLELGFVLFRGVYRELSSNLIFFEETGLFSKESALDILDKLFKAFDLEFNQTIFRRYLECEIGVQLELVPYSLEKSKLVQSFERFFTEERDKKLKVSELLMSGGVGHYNYLAKEEKILHQKITTLDTKLVQQRQELEMSENAGNYDYLVKESKLLGQKIVTLNKDLNHQRQELEESNEEVTELVRKVHTRNATISNIQRSFSWRVTEPIRMTGYLVKGNFTKAIASVRQIRQSVVDSFYSSSQWLLSLVENAKSTDSKANEHALEFVIDRRCQVTKTHPALDPLSATKPEILPAVDISVVTYNSVKWIAGFVESLISLDYPKELLSIHFVDNGSQDKTVEKIEVEAEKLKTTGCNVSIHQQNNKGYGGGHNVAIKAGFAQYCLITNVDLVFDAKSLQHVVATAVEDEEDAAAWELRQRPYEHPKFYDPVTGITNWNSHACVLFKRSALEQVDGYDEALFMYGEDVELSYRLRRSGALLRYCPRAVVEHFSYDHAEQIKPMQYKGSTFANFYLRLKYGNSGDFWAVPFLVVQLLLSPSPFSGAKLATLGNVLKLIVLAPKALLSRKSSAEPTYFPFRTWDYELMREGAFVEQLPLPSELPLVSVITRTYKGREQYLRQALLSVAHQSYPSIEHIIVEDGGDTLKEVVVQTNQLTDRSARFIENDKLGRSVAGNTGLERATGKYCMFLDDDDLLFGDHVELLVAALSNEQNVVAAYSFAWEVLTDTSDLSEGKYWEKYYHVPSVLQEEYDYETLKDHNLMAIQSILFERKLFEERGGFDADLDVLEDWVLWLCYGYENKIIQVPKVTSLFRTPLNQRERDSRQEVIDAGYQLARERAEKRIKAFRYSNEEK